MSRHLNIALGLLTATGMVYGSLQLKDFIEPDSKPVQPATITPMQQAPMIQPTVNQAPLLMPQVQSTPLALPSATVPTVQPSTVAPTVQPQTEAIRAATCANPPIEAKYGRPTVKSLKKLGCTKDEAIKLIPTYRGLDGDNDGDIQSW